MTLPHVKWLVDTGKQITTTEGVVVDVWQLTHIDDQRTLSKWAEHFRNHYCPDDLLDALAEDTGLSKAEYLKQLKFPSKAGFGPGTKSGDFAEILVADFIEYVEGYWCPRERYLLKWNTDESTKGSDVVGFKFTNVPRPEDEMYVLESKADLSGAKHNRLQDAVDDSAKDRVRHAMTLNALKQRFLERGQTAEAQTIGRFQGRPDYPFVFRSGAVLVVSDEHFDPDKIKTTICAEHPNRERLTLLVVLGEALMDLVHALYERAANEA
jgi:hypothetical protein